MSEQESAALSAALAKAGVPLHARSEAYDSAWRRVAAREAVDNQPARTVVRYARSPRSTRGATSA